MGTLVLLRHGQSQWNLENRFTGWWDVDLSAQGEKEARSAGTLLAEAGLAVDVAHTSVLTRAIRTLDLALEEMGRLWVPVHRHWRLNERHYGALTGLDKAETKAALRRRAQFMAWRRSYDTPPPPMPPGHRFDVRGDPRYAGLAPDVVPATECLADVVVRHAALLVRRHRPGPPRRPHRAGRRPRQQPPGPDQAPRGHLRRRHHRRWRSPPACRSSTSSTVAWRSPAERELGDPDAIAAAAEAVRRQGDR